MVASYHLCLVSLLAALAIIRQTEGDTPRVEFVIYNNALETRGGTIFESKLRNNAKNAMELALIHIWKIFGQSDSPEGERVKVKKIVLAIEGRMEKNSNFEFRNEIGRIGIKADHLANCKRNTVGSDFWDLIYYEMTHILQWNGKGKTPLEIRDGIAAYIVLSVGNGHPTGWVELGGGSSWDESPNVTGRFFQYVNDDLSCPEFVRKLNEKMKDSYEENYFYELTEKTISEAWKKYQRKYRTGPVW